MTVKRTYDISSVVINNMMSNREKKIFSFLLEWRDYAFIAKRMNTSSSEIGKAARKYIKKKICQQKHS